MSGRSAIQAPRHATQAMAAALLLGLLSGTLARAQQQEPPADLPPVTMTPPPASSLPPSHPLELPPAGPDNQRAGSGAAGPKTNDGKGDGKAALEKLNNDLRRKVDEVNPTIASPPLDARSPDTKIGVINIPAVKQQYGSNFGRSAVPFRPPPLIYNTAPVGHR